MYKIAFNCNVTKLRWLYFVRKVSYDIWTFINTNMIIGIYKVSYFDYGDTSEFIDCNFLKRQLQNCLINSKDKKVSISGS